MKRLAVRNYRLHWVIELFGTCTFSLILETCASREQSKRVPKITEPRMCQLFVFRITVIREKNARNKGAAGHYA